MSISRFQEKFLSGGCAKLFLGGMAAVFVGGLLWYGAGGSKSQEQDERNSKPVATVGSVEIPLAAVSDEITKRTDQYRQSMQGQPEDPIQLASIGAGTITGMVNDSLAMYLARQQNADFSDAAVRKALADSVDQQMDMAKMQIMYSGQLKQNATDKDFVDFVKARTGKTPDELKADQMKEIEEKLKNPETKPQLQAQAASGVLLQALKLKMRPTDEELKQYYSTVESKRILVKDEGAKKAHDVAFALLADIRAGKLKFEQAIDRHSKDLPQPNKRLSDTMLPIPGSAIATSEEYKGLRGLKAGDTSDVIDLPDGAAIYKVVKITSNVPKDYEKNKQKYLDELTTQRASAELQKQIDDAKKSDLVKFQAPGYEALYEYGKVLNDPANNMDPSKRVVALQAVYDKARKALDQGGIGEREATLVQYAAFDAIYNAPGANKEKLADQRVEALETYLRDFEDGRLRLELVDVYLAKKDGDQVAESLQTAASYNNDYGPVGQKLYGDAMSRYEKAKAAKLLKPDQEAAIQKEFDRWRQEKADYEKQKAADEAQRKKDEAEMKRQEAEFKKEQQKAKNESKAAPPKAGATKP